METLRQSLRDAPVISRNGYEYFVHGVTDGIPRVDPIILEEIVSEVISRVDMSSIDVIVAPEAMGIHHATALSLETGIPFVIIRKRPYGFDDEVAVHQSTSYSENECYINDISPDDRILLIDDVLSSGGTIKSMYTAITEIGADIEDVIIVINRADVESESLPQSVTSLLDVVVENGNVKIIN